MQSLSKYAPQALAVLRIVTALLFIEHGTAKLFGFPAMAGPGSAGGSLPPILLLAAILEVFGGLAILVGFFTRPVAFILSGLMAVAYWMAHVPKGGFIPLTNGGDAAVLFCFIFLYLVFAGPGAWSIDGRTGSSQPTQ
jgi:putative oxidoreductase